MINIIQIVLILVSFFIAVKVLSKRNAHSIKAWKKITVVLLVIFAIFAVLFPDNVTILANMVGVTRGTDLLLYVLFALFLVYILMQYLNSKDERDRLTRLARRVAIIEANDKYEIK